MLHPRNEKDYNHRCQLYLKVGKMNCTYIVKAATNTEQQIMNRLSAMEALKRAHRKVYQGYTVVRVR